MLDSLLGSKSVEKILLYLLVNEKCYAHELHRMLCTPLTPIQQALSRLERGSILKSNIEGNKRIYQFNLEYPLLNELEILLRKAFYQLPLQEKKYYTYQKQKKGHENLIELAWNHLKHITQVTLIAKSRSWNRKGSGKVSVTHDGNTITFEEKGSWKELSQTYRNTFRWTRNDTLSLEHLRYGEKHPVFLFHLTPTHSDLLESLTPHLCGEDTYFGSMQYSDLFLQLHIRTIGPQKNEEIEYIYT